MLWKEKRLWSHVIFKVQILHNYGRDWSRDLKKGVFKVQSGSELKHSGLRLK